MELQGFVSEVIEALGGVVIPQEYALCQVLIPEEYKEYFQGRTELVFSFDYEVAGENPESEFVTFGSYWLEQIFRLARNQAISTIRFIEVDRMTLSHAPDKIKRFMEGESGQLTVEDERLICGGYVHLTCRIRYLSDETDDEVHKIWVDLSTGRCCEQMKKVEEQIPYRSEPQYSIPTSPTIGLDQAYAEACEQLMKVAEQGKERRQQRLVLDREKKRINEYYQELLAENRRRSLRKGTEAERLAEIADREAAIIAEREKQLQEMEQKYDVQIELALDHGIVYYMPQIEYTVRMSSRNLHKTYTLHYNLFSKHFVRVDG